MGRNSFSTLFLIAAGLLASCGPKPETIVVGSKNFTEQLILGEILAQHLEKRLGMPIERKLNLGGTLIAHQAILQGDIDLYPEYTGTALTAVLKAPVGKDPTTVLQRVRAGYEKEFGATWVAPFGFENTFAMVIRADRARRDRIQTLSQAAASGAWKFGAGYEFVQRSDGLAGLLKAYGLRESEPPATMDLGLLYQALESQDIEMAAANSTDGQLARSDKAVALADDKKYFPPYECAVIVRQATLAKYPKLLAALKELEGRIDARTMRRLNNEAQEKHRPISDLATEFLRDLY